MNLNRQTNTSSKIIELRGEAMKTKEVLVAYKIVCPLYLKEINGTKSLK